YRRSHGRAFDMASGPCLRACPERRSDDTADPARVHQSVWRSLCSAEECPRAHGTGDENARCAVWIQNGVWGEPEAHLWGARARTHQPNGQLCAVSKCMDESCGLSSQAERA